MEVAFGGGLDVETVAVLMAKPGADVLPKLEVEEADLCRLGPTVLEAAEEALVEELKELGPDEERTLDLDGKGRLLYLLAAAALDPAGTFHEAGRDAVAEVLVVDEVDEVVSLTPFSVVGFAGSSVVFDDRVIDTLLASFSPSFDTSFDALREEDEEVFVVVFVVVVVVAVFAGTLGADFDERVDFGPLFVTLSSPSALGFLELFKIKN